AAFAQAGFGNLTGVHELLGGKFDFGLLRIYRAARSRPAALHESNQDQIKESAVPAVQVVAPTTPYTYLQGSSHKPRKSKANPARRSYRIPIEKDVDVMERVFKKQSPIDPFH